jgi:hypothetical protein|eukprot:CAMPEP_0202965848 /NCGR_PEP_ID=MMETSP1396-20130829/9967_1 /ASSEMBLY_ACC=CAM_ASM_000872 /TAXON_ID= /ORGANISM="Pseudokeronopsis sp., Strain Brazil" /LENGTH=92 /DNA_ID=CAMNT_0049688993 /DNA_START=23 /DNA_END=301 /DNA_ORIENTATION=+
MSQISTSKNFMHTKAINLARRWSVQNENDLMQENLYADTMDTPVHDREYCAQLAKHLMHMNSLPRGCLQYKDIANDLKRRDTDTTDPTSYLS